MLFFWHDSWDGHPSIISQFPHLQLLCNILVEAGWSKVEDFKTVKIKGKDGGDLLEGSLGVAIGWYCGGSSRAS